MTSRLDLADAARSCAQAEFVKWQAVLAHRDERVAALDREDTSSMYRRMAVNAIALKIAQTLHVSEQQVWRILEQGSRLREHLPTSWAAFADGAIDAQKASVLAVAVDRLTRLETRAALDDAVVAYATTHTPAELRRWADRLIDRLEPVTIDVAEAERARRHVRADATHDGMSYLTAYIPTPAARAITNRLAAAAKAHQPEDGRTRDQKQADLFCSWLTNATGTECDIRAEVAVVVEAAALAGVTGTAALVDGDAPIPPAWIFGLAASDSILWTRLLTDPAGHVLDVTHLGYQPPQALRRAAQWRDMTCRVSGCQRRAVDCDLDHDVPFEANGPTSGPNLRSLCRRHHGIKGHGLLPAGAYSPPEVHAVRLPAAHLFFEYVPAA